MRPGRASLLALLAFGLAPAAEARELYGPEAGVVPFGMGRAYSAAADDWLALYYNPAGLAMVNGLDLQLFDLRASSNRNVARSVKTAQEVLKSDNISNILNEFAGKHITGDFANFSQLTLPHFALGLSYEVHADVDMQNKAYPQTFTRYNRDFTVSVGSAVGLGPRKDLRLGLRFDFTNRTGGMRDLTIDELAGTTSQQALIDKFNAKGSGTGGTFGLQYRLPIPGQTEVTTSFVWSDIGKTTYGGREQVARPTRKEDSMTAGLAVRLPIGGRKHRLIERRYGRARSANHLTFAFDYSYLNTGLSEEQLPKHLHVGMNLSLPVFSLQLGLNQSSFTFGGGFDLGVVRVAVASYAEELGSYAGQRRDRRYVLSVGSSLGFKSF